MKSQDAISLERGAFVLSLDFELIWGTLDLFGPGRFGEACRIEREVVIDRLLDLLVEFDVPATWFVVGHLMLDHCDGEHADLLRPSHPWCKEDWFSQDAGGTEETAPLFFGRSLVEKIRACAVPQEIGCHSFSHVIFGDSGCSRETAQSELAACERAASALGIKMRSFAFPRNVAGHLDLLREYGYDSYRGPEPQREGLALLPTPLRRIANLWNVLTAAPPPVVLPEITEQGLWNIPGSMVYFPMHGARRYIPDALRVKRAMKGLDRAVGERRVFHLWFHPTNLSYETERIFSGLRRILERASTLRERGELNMAPVSALAPVEPTGAARSQRSV